MSLIKPKKFKVKEPTAMKVTSQITFFYYDDMKEASNFYEEIMGFPVVQDQGFAKIYGAGKSFFGIVDGKLGSLRPQKENAVMLTLLVDDVKEWHNYLVSKKVTVKQNPQICERTEFALYLDPGEYVIEIQHFIKAEEHSIFE